MVGQAPDSAGAHPSSHRIPTRARLEPWLLTFRLFLWTGQTWDQKSPVAFLKKLHSRDRSLETSLFLAFLPHRRRILIPASGTPPGLCSFNWPGVPGQTWISQPQIWTSPGLAVFSPALQSWEGRPGKTYPLHISEGQWDPALPSYTVERTPHHPSVRNPTGHVKQSKTLLSLPASLVLAFSTFLSRVKT